MRWNAGCKKYTSKGISKEDLATNFEYYGKIITTRDSVFTRTSEVRTLIN